MTRSVNPHLSSDDFDALLEGAASQDAHRHLAECAFCRDQVAADRTIVTRVEAHRPGCEHLLGDMVRPDVAVRVDDHGSEPPAPSDLTSCLASES